MYRDLTVLNARVTLRRCHVLEWDRLCASQRLDWRLIEEEAVFKKCALYVDDRKAYFQARALCTAQLTQLSVGQRDQRQQLRKRQQREFLLLEQSVDTTYQNVTRITAIGINNTVEQ